MFQKIYYSLFFYYLGLGSGKTVSGRSAAARTMSIISVSCILAPCTKLIEGGRGAGGGQKVVIKI